MILYTYSHKDKLRKRQCVNELKKIINDKTIIVNIGTDRCIADAVAPIVGTILKERKFKLQVFGTLDEPIHALNINEKLNEITDTYKNYNIIAIDSCLSEKFDIGKIVLRDTPVMAGKGVGKKLPSVGNYSIVAIVDSHDDKELITRRNIRLNIIYNMAKEISDILILAYKSYSK